MSASFYDIMRYAKTGIASSDMTAYDKMRAVAMAGGGAIKTLTGVPPLSFSANGKPLISWSMLGNGVQNGTPAPDAPIMPTFCGERTANLFDGQLLKGVWDSTSTRSQTGSDVFRSFKLKLPAGTYTISFDIPINLVRLIVDGELRSNIETNVTEYTVASTTDGDIGFSFRDTTSAQTLWNNSPIMLNAGSTPLPYEPYGWKIPITCAGQTQAVYLGQVQTVRRVRKLVLTGDEAWGISDGTISDNTFFQMTMAENEMQPVSAISSHFTFTTIAASTTTVGFYITALNHFLRIRPSNVTTFTLETFKQWLSAKYTAGTPVVIWYVLAEPETAIVNEPLAKIGGYADELHSADAGITIPTAKGANTLTVDTELQPSSMTITYR